MSWWLTRAGVDHVVLERGVSAQSWRARRWDSLRLLTPNWMSRLPGYGYEGDDPDGYQRAGEVVALLEGYGRAFGAPVRPHTTVVGVGGTASGFVVDTDDGPWRCRAVVVATGTESEAKVPALARDLPGHLHQITALGYRGPGQVAPGEVLVVGASASGVQIADELRRAGRPVTVAVAKRPGAADLPRARITSGWTAGILDERFDEVEDWPGAAAPSLQLVGTPQRRSLDLATLAAGVCSSPGASSGWPAGAPSLLRLPAAIRQARLLERIDTHVGEHGLHDQVGRPTGAPTPMPGDQPTRPVLRRGLGHPPPPLPLARPRCSTTAAPSAMTAGARNTGDVRARLSSPADAGRTCSPVSPDAQRLHPLIDISAGRGSRISPARAPQPDENPHGFREETQAWRIVDEGWAAAADFATLSEPATREYVALHHR
jgi:putative flavoprotein involved in K+ transport